MQMHSTNNAEHFNLMGYLLFAYNEIEPVILVGISFDAIIEIWNTYRTTDFIPDF